MQSIQCAIILTLSMVLWLVGSASGAWGIGEGDRVYIEDRTGERWDVTQAREMGFIPQRFQYGIGKNAFTPLRDKDFTNDHPSTSSGVRIIGVSIEGDAHAYAVDRLSRHEIANTTIAGRAIAAGY